MTDEESSFEAPDYVMSLATSDLSECVLAVVNRVRSLPAALQADLRENPLLSPEAVDELVDLAMGLAKLRNKELPSLDQLSALSDPGALLQDVASGMQSLVDYSKVPSLPGSVEACIGIGTELERIAADSLPTLNAYRWITDWVSRVQREKYPEEAWEGRANQPPAP